MWKFKCIKEFNFYQDNDCKQYLLNYRYICPKNQNYIMGQALVLSEIEYDKYCMLRNNFLFNVDIPDDLSLYMRFLQFS